MGFELFLLFYTGHLLVLSSAFAVAMVVMMRQLSKVAASDPGYSRGGVSPALMMGLPWEAVR